MRQSQWSLQAGCVNSCKTRHPHPGSQSSQGFGPGRVQRKKANASNHGQEMGKGGETNEKMREAWQVDFKASQCTAMEKTGAESLWNGGCGGRRRRGSSRRERELLRQHSAEVKAGVCPRRSHYYIQAPIQQSRSRVISSGSGPIFWEHNHRIRPKIGKVWAKIATAMMARGPATRWRYVRQLSVVIVTLVQHNWIPIRHTSKAGGVGIDDWGFWQAFRASIEGQQWETAARHELGAGSDGGADLTTLFKHDKFLEKRGLHSFGALHTENGAPRGQKTANMAWREERDEMNDAMGKKTLSSAAFFRMEDAEPGLWPLFWVSRCGRWTRSSEEADRRPYVRSFADL